MEVWYWASGPFPTTLKPQDELWTLPGGDFLLLDRNNPTLKYVRSFFKSRNDTLAGQHSESFVGDDSSNLASGEQTLIGNDQAGAVGPPHSNPGVLINLHKWLATTRPHGATECTIPTQKLDGERGRLAGQPSPHQHHQTNLLQRRDPHNIHPSTQLHKFCSVFKVGSTDIVIVVRRRWKCMAPLA